MVMNPLFLTKWQCPRGETSEVVCKHNLKKLFTPLCGRGRQQSAVKITGTAFQAGDIFGVIVGSVILPATPHDSLPFEGQRADRRLATLAALDLHLVIYYTRFILLLVFVGTIGNSK